MMKWTSLVVTAALALVSLNSFAGDVRTNVIYGKDNRLDYYQAEAKWQKLADSTVALFPSSSVSLNTSTGLADLDVQKYGDRMRLCSGERFFDQYMGAFCSGSLVGEDLILTAGHCVEDQASCENTRFVFGFNVQRDGEFPKSVRADNIFECKKLIDRKQDGNGADWALIRVSRKATEQRPLAVARTDVKKDTAITVVGHPVGLPVKVSGGAKVRKLEKGYFVANLDTYGGNSGSAVFNDKTGEVAGVLVRGETDFVVAGGCRKSNICADGDCRGEDVTQTTAFIKVLDTALKH